MTQMEVITGRDLIKHARKTDVSDFILSQIDPDGNSIVSLWFPHNGPHEVRVVLLAKLRDSMEPYTLIFTVPTDIFKRMNKKITYEAGEISEN